MRKLFGLDRNVFYLGIVSFLTDISSEMTLTLLPLFLTNVLGVAMPIVGLIEGFAEATASLLKIVSGRISDISGRRKPLTVLGYGISSLMKPLLALAGSWPLVLAVRFADRVGKGIRSSPRDALIAESAAPEDRGRAFGWHRAADTAGALVGLSLAAGIIWFTQRNAQLLDRETFRTIVLWGAIPGFLSVGVLVWGVKEAATTRAHRDSGEKERRSLNWRVWQGMDPAFLKYLAVMALFTLGNSSDAFLLLRVQSVGLTTLQIALMLVAYNVIYSAFALPAGILSDRLGRKQLLIFGWGLYALIYLGFGWVGEGGGVAAVGLYIAYGLYYANTEGVGRAYVADLVPSHNRATAYGLYYGVVGLIALPASVLAGSLWAWINPAAPFYFGAALAGVAALLLWFWVPNSQGKPT
ncbi:MAG: MFS transporter [Caldilineaceae bacterium]|nr:MFS transporter [Caldilineaceae bacterium]MBP8105995.1 MFS transporter [Caldilineaceae bacterium]MBP8123681.1 MFS transporter [Caldilineaceae bacterium]MBP9071915.1 MFS transporter [Caldilineaceae bacterium]